MSLDIHFHTLDDERDVSKLIDFIHHQDLHYPNYQDWVQRTESELHSGYKHAIVASSQDKVVGDIIWQQHKQISKVRELKNLRVDQRLRGRYIGAFLLRQAECEKPEQYDCILGDVNTNQKSMIALLLQLSYTPLGTTQLYNSNNQDTIMIKTLNTKTQSGIIHNARSIFGLN